MAKSVISNKRYRFPAGIQRKFICTCLEKLGYKNKDTAKKLLVSIRSITDWKREKFLIPVDIAKILSNISKVRIPKNVKELDKFWYVSKGARKGGLASYKIQGGVIGNPEIRKKNWWYWWEKEGKFKPNPIFTRFGVRKPLFSNKLAEFFGIMMGDGGMNKFQIKITLHHKDDLGFTKYVISLIWSLFRIKPSVYHRPKLSVNDLAISRVELVDYLHLIGLPIGNKVKQNFNIPNWIKRNKNFSINCIRGLVDTDGSVITHKYKVNKKIYSYKRLEFTSLSRPMINSVFKIMRKNGLHPRITKDRKNIHLDNQNDVFRYFKIFGSHNPKHLKRYKQ